MLALLTLTSTTGLAIDAHYCKDKLASISVWGKAKSCTQAPIQEELEHSKTHSNNQQVSKRKCCSSKSSFNKAEVTTDFSSFQSLKEIQFAFSFSSNVLIINTFNTSSFTSNFLLKPPLINKDFSVVYQNFRI